MTVVTPRRTEEEATHPSTLATAAWITVGGSLAWLAWVWGLALVALLLLLVGAEVRDDALGSSLWQFMGANWQRWVLLGAGASMVPTFLPMLVANGVTRSTAARATTITMVALAAIGATVIAAGYSVEDAAFARNDWRHVVGADEVAAGGVRFLAGAWVHNLLGLAAYFASGWLIGAAFYRLGKDVAWPLVLPSLLPAAAAELLLDRTGGFGFGYLFGGLHALPEPHAAVGLPLAALAVALASVVARRVVVETPLKP